MVNMIEKRIIASLITCIFFNVFLNSFDHYSDVTLAYETMANNFDLGNSLLLSACRVCHGKTASDIYSVKKTKCQKCVIENLDFQCGNDINVLGRLSEPHNSENCENDDIVARWNQSSRNYNLINSNCESSKRNQSWDRISNHDEGYVKRQDYVSCCIKEIETSKQNVSDSWTKNISNPLDHLDKKILAHRPFHKYKFFRHILQYDHYDNILIYYLSAKFSLHHCQNVYAEYFNEYNQIYEFHERKKGPGILYFLRRNVFLQKEENETEWHYRFSEQRDGSFKVEKGFTAEDRCGFLVQRKPEQLIQNNAEQTCGLDPCLLHLQSLKRMLNISNFDQWKHNTFFSQGKKLGGETCFLLWNYGVACLIPSALNLIFHMFIFVEDLKSGRASKEEFLLVILFFYPQWKTIRFLTEYCTNKNEKQLKDAQGSYSEQFGHVEPFLESAFQVRSRFCRKFISIFTLF